MPSFEPSADAAPLAPRLLTKAADAAYCVFTGSGFDHWITMGKLLGPIAGTRRWDKVAFDLALDRLSGIHQSKPGPKPSGLAAYIEKRASRKAAEAA